MQELGHHNAYWCDDEWHSWDDFGPVEDDFDTGLLAEIECDAEIARRYPKANIEMVRFLRELLELAEWFHRETGRHLTVYGEIGELFGAAFFGVKLHRPGAQGSDGRVGNDFVEIKTISPAKEKAATHVRLENRNFGKVLVVKIDGDFRITGRMVDRKVLKGRSKARARLSWQTVESLAAEGPRPGR